MFRRSYDFWNINFANISTAKSGTHLLETEGCFWNNSHQSSFLLSLPSCRSSEPPSSPRFSGFLSGCSSPYSLQPRCSTLSDSLSFFGSILLTCPFGSLVRSYAFLESFCSRKFLFLEFLINFDFNTNKGYVLSLWIGLQGILCLRNVLLIFIYY